jgi:uncharacterized protein YaaN involved in tellurite resistance
MKIYEHNVETNTALERDMTAAEIKQFNADKLEAEAIEKARSEAAAARLIAEDKLSKLGLTLDDLRALGL